MNDRPQIQLKVLDERLHEWGLPRHQSDLAAGIDLIACLREPLLVPPQAASEAMMMRRMLRMFSP